MDNISVVFTCKGRPELTELCLRRFKELMPEPYELIIAYDGKDVYYENMLVDVGDPALIIDNLNGRNRFALINDAISCASNDLIMHLENDFYWVDPTCLPSAMKTIAEYDVNFVRFEYLPFTMNQFDRIEQIEGHDVCWMRPETPYRFNFNPHLRNFKFPSGKLLQTDNFWKQPEQIFNDKYTGISTCVTGDNWRHLGIYDEGGHFKEYYAERFFGIRGKRETSKNEMLLEFNQLTDNSLYQSLFKEYIAGIL